MMEHSDRARYVTEQVKLWIVNDFRYYNDAVWLAKQEDSTLETYLRMILTNPTGDSAAWHVAQELAPNDYDRINWDDVRNELIGE